MVQDLVRRRWCSFAVQIVTEPEICHGKGFCLRADARIRVPGHDKLSRKQKCRKNRDEFINATVRVICRVSFKIVKLREFYLLIMILGLQAQL